MPLVPLDLNTVKRHMPELPPRESGLDVDDIRRAILQAQRDQGKRPSLAMLTNDVPPEYEPAGDEIPEIPDDGPAATGDEGGQDGGL